MGPYIKSGNKTSKVMRNLLIALLPIIVFSIYKNGYIYVQNISSMIPPLLFNYTINEDILDMQGITEAVSKYYYLQGNSFEGLSVSPEYQERFERLASEAVEYYND